MRNWSLCMMKMMAGNYPLGSVGCVNMGLIANYARQNKPRPCVEPFFTYSSFCYWKRKHACR